MVVNNIPRVKIGDGKNGYLEFILIQGGMGVGISGAKLSSAVAEYGGAGIIASVGLGVLNHHFEEERKKNRARLANASSEDQRKEIRAELYIKANQDALREEIREARKRTNGIIGVNIMHALSDYSGLVRTAVEENVDLIISGAGIPRDLPSYLDGKNIKLLPIVSSGKLAGMMCKAWQRLGHLPDAIVVEGPMAGGHLGYNRQELDDKEFVAHGLEKIIPEVIQAVDIYQTDQKRIPVIAAGGIFYGGDIRRFNELGAKGVQMATRFVTTNECDADNRFKQAYIDCEKEDLIIINSPVGMPGRAIVNNFLKRVEAGETVPIVCPYHCLKTCKPDESPYCIARALVEAQKGEFRNGYVFAGSNAHRNKDVLPNGELVPVAKVFEDLDREYGENKRSD